MKSQFYSGWMLVVLATLASGNVVAQSVQMQGPVPFAEDNDISDAIKTECKIGEVLANSVKASSQVPVELTAETPDKASGRVLQVEIVDAVSMGNAFMGPLGAAVKIDPPHGDAAQHRHHKGRKASKAPAQPGKSGPRHQQGLAKGNDHE